MGAPAKTALFQRVRQSELYNGWPLVLACAIGVGCSAVALPFYTIGVLTSPLQDAFGWSRTQIQTAIVFSTGFGAITAPAIGLLTDRYGARAVALPSVFLLALAFAVTAMLTAQIWTLYAAYAAISILGAGTNPTTWTRAIAGQFSRQRGLALGLALTGTGLCAVFAPQYALWLRESYGWQAIYWGLAVLVVCCALPVTAFFFKERQKSPADRATLPTAHGRETGLTLSQAIRGYRFWVLLSSIFAIYLAVSGVIPNLVPAMTDRGLSVQQATNVVSVIGLAIIFGRFGIGLLIDFFWAPMVAAIATFLPVIACVLFITVDDPELLMLAAILTGLAAGAELDLLAFFTARYFGLQHYARIYGVFYIALAVAGGAAPPLFAFSFDLVGSYQVAFIGAAVLFAFGAGIILTLGGYPEFEKETTATK